MHINKVSKGLIPFPMLSSFWSVISIVSGVRSLTNNCFCLESRHKTAAAAIVAASSIGCCHTTIAGQSRSLPDVLLDDLHGCYRIVSGACEALCMGSGSGVPFVGSGVAAQGMGSFDSLHGLNLLRRRDDRDDCGFGYQRSRLVGDHDCYGLGYRRSRLVGDLDCCHTGFAGPTGFAVATGFAGPTGFAVATSFAGTNDLDCCHTGSAGPTGWVVATGSDFHTGLAGTIGSDCHTDWVETIGSDCRSGWAETSGSGCRSGQAAATDSVNHNRCCCCCHMGWPTTDLIDSRDRDRDYRHRNLVPWQAHLSNALQADLNKYLQTFQES